MSSTVCGQEPVTCASASPTADDTEPGYAVRILLLPYTVGSKITRWVNELLGPHVGLKLFVHLAKRVAQGSAGDLHPAVIRLMHLENEKHRSGDADRTSEQGNNDRSIQARE